MDRLLIGNNRRKLLQTVDDSFNELYETKQNKVWYSDAEPSDIESEDGDLWISTTSSITPPPIEYRDVDLSNYAANNIPNYMTITELPQDIEEYLSSGIRATNMRRAFYNCRYLKKLDFNKYRIDTSKCQVMSYAFNTCSDLEELDLSSFDTSNVTDMSYMFRACSSLTTTTLDLSSFDTSNVNNMANMFRECSSLTTLDLSSFNTSNVNTMRYMFEGCTSLTALDLSSFNTSNVGATHYMFNECSSLTTLDLSSFNTSNVSTMDHMFNGCTKLTEIKGVIDLHNQSNSANYRNMFTGCPISPSTPVQIKNPPSDENWWQTAGFASQDQFIIVS